VNEPGKHPLDLRDLIRESLVVTIDEKREIARKE
jgi:hypothetical protein